MNFRREVRWMWIMFAVPLVGILLAIVIPGLLRWLGW